jgi:dinuclear metal center YbgI/SA1388 family protein
MTESGALSYDHASVHGAAAADCRLMATLAEIVGALDHRYDRAWAQSWDSIGLVCGDPEAPVTKVHFAIDPVGPVADEAIATGAQLLVCHHPLFLGGTDSVAATTPKGRLVHRLISSGVGLYVAHTNADVAADGVGTALATACGLAHTEPLTVSEDQPLGRVGDLAEPVTLRGFVERLASRLPQAAGGIRVAGPPDAVVRRVALLGGAGDDLFDAVRASGADVYVTADLRHHPALEAREEARGGPPYLVDAGHWASEQVWLAVAQEALRAALGERATRVETHISTVRTDPWTFVVGADPGGTP